MNLFERQLFTQTLNMDNNHITFTAQSQYVMTHGKKAFLKHLEKGTYAGYLHFSFPHNFFLPFPDNFTIFAIYFSHVNPLKLDHSTILLFGKELTL